MHLVDCDNSHSDSILAILNDAIVNSTALYDYRPRTAEMMVDWFDAKRRGGFPVIGVVDDGGGLMGFATYGTFRAFPAYKYTVEHSLYVAEQYRGRGIGKRLLGSTIERAEKQGYHLLVGGIDSGNVASIALHKQFGFEHAGTIKQAGYKFGRWLDLCFYQLILPTPACPVES